MTRRPLQVFERVASIACSIAYPVSRGELMITKQMCAAVIHLTAGIVCLCCMPLPAYGQTLDGKAYYVYTIDVSTMTLQHSTISFTASSLAADSDNASSDSDNLTREAGAMTLSIESKNFDNATGTFMSRGMVFQGTWEGVESEYSSYYKENRYRYYSFFFYGVLAGGNGYGIAGVVISTVTEQSPSTEPRVYRGIVPFFGVMISEAENSGQTLQPFQ